MAIGIYNMLMESYTYMFAGFLHINFVTRIFLFIVFSLFTAVVLEVVIIPVFLWLFGPSIVKGWNYAVTETISEYIYIKFLSDTNKVPSDRISALYNKQQRKIEKNNEYIDNKGELNETGKSRWYRRILNRKIGAKTGQVLEKLTIIFSIIFVISTFAHDFAYSKGIGKPQSSNKSTVTSTADNSQTEDSETATNDNLDEYNEVADSTSEETEAVKKFILNEGTKAANIRTEPSLETSSVIEQVTNAAVLEYMGESAPFGDGSSDLWYKVKTESGTIGWISGRIVVEKE